MRFEVLANFQLVRLLTSAVNTSLYTKASFKRLAKAVSPYTLLSNQIQ